MKCLPITKIEKVSEEESIINYYVTLDNNKTIRVVASFLFVQCWIHSNDFDDINEFKTFFREVMMKSHLFHDRLRYLLVYGDRIYMSCNDENMSKNLSKLYDPVEKC